MFNLRHIVRKISKRSLPTELKSKSSTKSSNELNIDSQTTDINDVPSTISKTSFDLDSQPNQIQHCASELSTPTNTCWRSIQYPEENISAAPVLYDSPNLSDSVLTRYLLDAPKDQLECMLTSDPSKANCVPSNSSRQKQVNSSEEDMFSHRRTSHVSRSSDQSATSQSTQPTIERNHEETEASADSKNIQFCFHTNKADKISVHNPFNTSPQDPHQGSQNIPTSSKAVLGEQDLIEKTHGLTPSTCASSKNLRNLESPLSQQSCESSTPLSQTVFKKKIQFLTGCTNRETSVANNPTPKQSLQMQHVLNTQHRSRTPSFLVGMPVVPKRSQPKFPTIISKKFTNSTSSSSQLTFISSNSEHSQVPNTSSTKNATPRMLKTRKFYSVISSFFDRFVRSSTTPPDDVVHQVTSQNFGYQTPLPSTASSLRSRGDRLLGKQQHPHIGKPTLVLDLDETLVHSSFVQHATCSFRLTMKLEDTTCKVYVARRPGVDVFLKQISEYYEIIIFTASLPQYANLVVDQLDPEGLCAGRLYRDSCMKWKGHYIKDLSRLGRDIKRVVIVDNSAISYAFHPENALPIESWFEGESDTQLFDLIPLLVALAQVDDIPTTLGGMLKNLF